MGRHPHRGRARPAIHQGGYLETLGAGDVLLGGEGVGLVSQPSGGTFLGGGGDDGVGTQTGGTFRGGGGDDRVGDTQD